MERPRFAHGKTASCSWEDRELFMGIPRVVHGKTASCSWDVPDECDTTLCRAPSLHADMPLNPTLLTLPDPTRPYPTLIDPTRPSRTINRPATGRANRRTDGSTITKPPSKPSPPFFNSPTNRGKSYEHSSMGFHRRPSLPIATQQTGDKSPPEDQRGSRHSGGRMPKA